MKITVTENTDVCSPSNGGCMTTLGLGSFSAPEAPASTGVTEGLFLHSYSRFLLGGTMNV